MSNRHFVQGEACLQDLHRASRQYADRPCRCGPSPPRRFAATFEALPRAPVVLSLHESPDPAPRREFASLSSFAPGRSAVFASRSSTAPPSSRRPTVTSSIVPTAREYPPYVLSTFPECAVEITVLSERGSFVPQTIRTTLLRCAHFSGEAYSVLEHDARKPGELRLKLPRPPPPLRGERQRPRAPHHPLCMGSPCPQASLKARCEGFHRARTL